MNKDKPIVQDSDSFVELAQPLVPSTKIKHFSDEEIANYKKTNLFRNSISVNSLFNMHVVAVDGSKTQLWKNSTYHKIRVKADINIKRNKHKCSDNDEIQHSVSYQWLTPLLSWKIIGGNFDGYFAVITEEGEQNDETEINYLKQSLGKRVVALRNDCWP